MYYYNGNRGVPFDDMTERKNGKRYPILGDIDISLIANVLGEGK